jgi:hypothetical protein
MPDGPPADLSQIDPSRPNPARMYDYYLDGKDNYAADREAAERILQIAPETVALARENRAFLRRALEVLLDEGVRQFLDLGTGIPTQGNVPEIVAAAGPDVPVVCVDNDPVACAHARALAAGRVHVLEADMRKPQAILSEAERIIDFSRPVGLVMAAVLHFVPDDGEAEATVSGFREALAPGSMLVLSHATQVGLPADIARAGTEIYRRSSSPTRLRSPEEIARFFDGFELLEPGLVNAAHWRPDAPVGDRPGARVYGGVGRLATE